MTTFVGAIAGTNTATLPSHQAGDLIIGFAYRDGNTTAPSLPAGLGWTSIYNATGANSNSHRVVWKIAAGSSETTGTFTNATTAIFHVYRPGSGNTLSVGDHQPGSGSGTTITYTALTLQGAANTSWVAGFAGHRSTNTSLGTAPGGMTNRVNPQDATDEGAGHDTNGTVASWSSTNVSVGGTSSGWRSHTIEIVENIPPAISAHPQNASKKPGETATFSITATGATSYQWQVDTGSGWGNVSGGSGATTDSYTTPTLALGDDGNQYRCQATNAGGTTNSNAATLTVTATLYYVVYPSAKSAPSATQVKTGKDADNSAAAASGSESAQDTAGEQVFASAATGLTGGTSYKVALVWSDGTNDSNVAVSAGWTTLSAAQFEGAAAAAAAASGALSTQITLEGAAVVAATATGAISTGINLVGAAASVTLAGGTLTTQIRLAGGAIAAAVASAGLTTAIQLAAQAQGGAAAAGALTTGSAQPLEGHALAAALASGALTVQIRLAGAAVARAVVSGVLSTQISVAGAAAAGASAQGSLTAQITLTGAAAAAAAAYGALSTDIRLGGAAVGQASAQGSLTTSVQMVGAAIARALASGNVSVGAMLAGAAIASAQAAGDMTTAIRLAGAVINGSAASGALTAPGTPASFAADATATATAAGGLTTQVRLVGQASVVALSTGDLTTAIRLDGAAAAAVQATGALDVSIRMRADAFAAAMASGALSTQVLLDAAAVAGALASGGLAADYDAGMLIAVPRDTWWAAVPIDSRRAKALRDAWIAQAPLDASRAQAALYAWSAKVLRGAPHAEVPRVARSVTVRGV